MKEIQSIRPKKILEYYSEIYPEAWKGVNDFREGMGKDLPSWPEWCFVPLSGTFAIVSHEASLCGYSMLDNVKLIQDVGILGALAGWRVTQSVYRFDKEIFNEIIRTPVKGDIPHDVLFNMPEWCIYIETPGLKFSEFDTDGFFAYLEYDIKTHRKELRLVFDIDEKYNEEKFPFLLSLPLHLGKWSLKESIDRVFEVDFNERKKLKKHNFNIEYNKINKFKNSLENYLNPFISLVIYICSANGEIGDKKISPQKPKPIKTKKGKKLFPPKKVKVWDVGVRMGAQLRKARKNLSKDYNYKSNKEINRQGTRKRPHIRKAHWHGYWTGPKNGEKKYIVKWIPPTLVNAEKNDELPITIRPVG